MPIRQRHNRLGAQFQFQFVNVPSFMVRERHMDFSVNSTYGQKPPGRNARKRAFAIGARDGDDE